MNAAITNKKIAELDDVIKQKDIIWTSKQTLLGIEQTFMKLKEFDEYENKLIKEKYDLSVRDMTLRLKI